MREPLSQDGKGLKLVNLINNVPEFVTESEKKIMRFVAKVNSVNNRFYVTLW